MTRPNIAVCFSPQAQSAGFPNDRGSAHICVFSPMQDSVLFEQRDHVLIIFISPIRPDIENPNKY